MADRLCDFKQPLRPLHCTASIKALAKILLGTSTAATDIHQALDCAPPFFLSALQTRDLAGELANLIVALASRGEGLRVTSLEIEEVFAHLFEFNFGAFGVEAIGFANAYAMKRLSYNVIASVVAQFHEKLSQSSTSKTTESLVEQLRVATDSSIVFVGGCRSFFPTFPFVQKWWTNTHQTAYVLELTKGTVVCHNSRESPSLAFLVFCDVLVENALQEWDRTQKSTSCYQSNAFAWMACSKAWHFVLKNPAKIKTFDYTKNIDHFNAVAFRSFYRPLTGTVNQKRTYTSPETEKRHAKVARAHAKPRSLVF